MDFISQLPVTVSKLVLSYVNMVWTCRGVNKRWYIIVKELLAEQRQFRSHVFRYRHTHYAHTHTHTHTHIFPTSRAG